MRYYLQFIIPLVTILGALIESKIDASKKHKIEHWFSSIIRFILIALSSTFLFFWSSSPIYYITVFTGLNLGLFWIVFDFSYNMHRGMNWYYIGKTAPLDKIARKITGNKGNTYLGIKVILTFICLILYVMFD